MKKNKFLILLMIISLTVVSFGGQSQREAGKFRILLSNDDGISAIGLEILSQKLEQIASVDVVAPSRNHSGVSHGLTLDQPLVVTPVKKGENENWFAADTTPATCIKLGLELLLQEKPDLVVSGINNGDNLGVMTFSSGTIGCAREASIKGIPAIAVSLARELDKEKEKLYLEEAADFMTELIKEIQGKSLKPGWFLNVNYPNLPRGDIKGVLLARQDTRAYPNYVYRPNFLEGKFYIWYDFHTIDAGSDDKTDSWGLRNGFITITPLKIDQTDSTALEELKTWKIVERKPPSN
jgi:5'-nucleotidase